MVVKTKKKKEKNPKVSIAFPPKLLEILKEKAEKEDRSFTAQVTWELKKALNVHE